MNSTTLSLTLATLLSLGLGVSQAAVVYRDVVMADNPTAYYRLGESAGTTASDETSNNLDGVYESSPGLGADGLLATDSDTAVDFTPVNGHNVDLPSMSFSGTGFSVEAWVTLNSFGGGGDANLRTIIGGTDGTSGFDLRVTNLGSLEFVFSSNTGQTTLSSANSVIAADGSSVYHIVGRYDATVTGTELQLYLNGSYLVQKTLAGAQANITTSNPIDIGRNGAVPTTRIWDGVIDEVALYDSALSSTRIQAHYDAGAVVPEPSTLLFTVLGGGILLWFRRSFANDHSGGISTGAGS